MSAGAKRGSSRRTLSVEFKRKVVDETLVSGASVAEVALLHGVNAPARTLTNYSTSFSLV
jgi:transposase-like protein